MFVDGLDQEAKKQLMSERAEQRNEQGTVILRLKVLM